MASWHRKFLSDFSTIADPLTRLTKKNFKYVWEEEQQRAFEHIKALVASAPFVHRPDFNSRFVIQTDASDSGLEAVLFQVIDGQERVVEFVSRALTRAERNYWVSERECLAVLSVKEHVRACLTCQQCKVEQKPPAGMMGRRTIRGLWKVVAGDITGPGIHPSIPGFIHSLGRVYPYPKSQCQDDSKRVERANRLALSRTVSIPFRQRDGV